MERAWQQMLQSPYIRSMEYQQKGWREHLTDEQRDLVTFARLFASHFEAGTADSKRLATITKLADLLDIVWSRVV